MGLLNKSKLKIQDYIDFWFKCSTIGFPQSNFRLEVKGEKRVFICINLMIFKKWGKWDQPK